MAYSGLTVTDASAKAAETDGTMSSSFIPAYPDTSGDTIVDQQFEESVYWARQQACNRLRTDS